MEKEDGIMNDLNKRFELFASLNKLECERRIGVSVTNCQEVILKMIPSSYGQAPVAVVEHYVDSYCSYEELYVLFGREKNYPGLEPEIFRTIDGNCIFTRESEILDEQEIIKKYLASLKPDFENEMEVEEIAYTP